LSQTQEEKKLTSPATPKPEGNGRNPSVNSKMRLDTDIFSRSAETYEDSTDPITVSDLYNELQEAAEDKDFERDSFIKEFAATRLYDINPNLTRPLNIEIFEQVLRAKLESLEASYN